MTTIVELDSSLAQMFASSVGTGATVLQSLDQLRRHLEHHPGEYAVVLGPSVDLGAATALSDTYRVARPALSVILARKRVDTAVLADSLRAGIREVVEDRDLTGLGNAVRRAHSLWQALTDNRQGAAVAATGQLVTVFSAKGGVGKSTLATNLSAALVDESKQPVRVCLVDLDLAFGDVAIMLQQFPNSTIADAVNLSQLDSAALESMLTPHSDGLVTLAAPLQPDAKDHIKPELVGRILHMLKASFDFVVVDTSPAFDDFVLQAFDHSDLILLIGTLDIPALKSLKVSTETLDLLNYPRHQWRLVLNRADSKVGLASADVEKALDMQISTSIPSSRDVPACVNRGVLIVREDPRHGVSQSIRGTARQVLQLAGAQATAVESDTAAETAGRRGGLLRRKSRTA